MRSEIQNEISITKLLSLFCHKRFPISINATSSPNIWRNKNPHNFETKLCGQVESNRIIRMKLNGSKRCWCFILFALQVVIFGQNKFLSLSLSLSLSFSVKKKKNCAQLSLSFSLSLSLLKEKSKSIILCGKNGCMSLLSPQTVSVSQIWTCQTHV